MLQFKSALFDFPSLLVVILLFICLTTHSRSLWPGVFNSPASEDPTNNSKHNGIKGICWKASRIGERLSPYIGSACIVMAFHLLFVKE